LDLIPSNLNLNMQLTNYPISTSSSPFFFHKSLEFQFLKNWDPSLDLNFYEPKPKPPILTLQTRYLPTTGLNLVIRGAEPLHDEPLVESTQLSRQLQQRKVVRKKWEICSLEFSWKANEWVNSTMVVGTYIY
jgi:hypothetical protein